MEIEIKSQSDDEIVFIVRDAEVPFINAIRRCAMVNVPKIAIEDVEYLWYINRTSSTINRKGVQNGGATMLLQHEQCDVCLC